MGAAVVLLLSLFLPWFATSASNRNSEINGLRAPEGGRRAGDFTAWDTFGVLDYLLLAACIAPFVLAYILMRGHELSWRPGEVTAIVGITAFVLILCNGIILGKPGDVEIGFRFGYLVALLGAAGIFFGGALRQAEGKRARKPPGTI